MTRRIVICILSALSILLIITACDPGSRIAGRIPDEYRVFFEAAQEQDVLAFLRGNPHVLGDDVLFNQAISIAQNSNNGLWTRWDAAVLANGIIAANQLGLDGFFLLPLWNDVIQVDFSYTAQLSANILREIDFRDSSIFAPLDEINPTRRLLTGLLTPGMSSSLSLMLTAALPELPDEDFSNIVSAVTRNSSSHFTASADSRVGMYPLSTIFSSDPEFLKRVTPQLFQNRFFGHISPRVNPRATYSAVASSLSTLDEQLALAYFYRQNVMPLEDEHNFFTLGREGFSLVLNLSDIEHISGTTPALRRTPARLPETLNNAIIVKAITWPYPQEVPARVAVPYYIDIDAMFLMETEFPQSIDDIEFLILVSREYWVAAIGRFELVPLVPGSTRDSRPAMQIPDDRRLAASTNITVFDWNTGNVVYQFGEIRHQSSTLLVPHRDFVWPDGTSSTAILNHIRTRFEI